MKFLQIFTVICLFKVSVAVESSLRLVNLVYRHGDRSPVVIFPKDINKEDSWPNGLGWLTKEGMMMHYKFGQWLRNRYDGFLNSSYIHTEIEVASSNEDRCLMSAYCNLAGLYLPQGSQIWNPDVKSWQPIPVHTRPEKEDNVINMGEKCPRYDKLLKETMETPEIKEEENRNKEFYKFIGDKTGMDHENISNIWMVADTLFCEKAHNLTVVPWADQMWKTGNQTVYQKLRTLDSYQFRLLFSGQEKARLKGGPILGEFVQQMLNATRKKIDTKMFMYSGHDTTVAALLTALNLFENGTSPPYAASVIVELHQNTKGQYFVRVFYKNTTDTAYQLTVPGCSADCLFEEFQRLTKPYIPVDWKKECGLSSQADKSKSFTTYQIITVVLAAVILVLLTVIIITFCRLRKEKVLYRNFR